MRNLFLINSYLTYIVARLVLEVEGYCREDSIFVFFRGISPLDHSKYISYQFVPQLVDINMPFFPNYLKFYKGRRLKLDLFKQIRSVTNGEKFRVHVFQTNSRVVQLIRSMPECESTHILEEGSAVYDLNIEQLDKLYRYVPNGCEKLLNFLNYGTSIKTPGFIEKGLHCYCLFEDAFKGTKNKTILFDQSKVLEILKPYLKIEPGSVIFIHTYFDPPTRELMDLYSALVIQMCRQFSSWAIYHRFHPSQDPESRSLIMRKLIENKLDTKQMPECDPIENYVFSPQPFTFIGWESSVFYYARRMGKTVFSARV
jgi:hypothetical protein